MARAYRHRPPYGEEALEILLSLLGQDAADTAILDVGCGTGDLARALAPHTRRVDAVDASQAMIEEGRAQPGGKAANLRWFAAPMETAPLGGPYALAVAGESVHWMNWDLVFPRIADVLAPGAVFAIVERREALHAWSAELAALIGRYSTNQDYVPFDLVPGLEERGHFEVTGSHETEPVSFTQPREDFIACIHSRNGFSRARMGVKAPIFDAAFRDLLMRHGVGEDVTFDVSTRLRWGHPRH